VKAELGQSTNPRDFVPGDPTTIRSDATAWTAVADRLDDVVFELSTIEVEGWEGDAADAFAEKLNEHVKRWQVAAGVYRAAAQTISTYADHLDGAQRTAQIAIDLYEAGETARAEWTHAQQKAAKAAGHGQVSTSLVADPGAGDREEARQLMLSAQRTASAEADLAQDQLSGRAAEIEKLNADLLEMLRVTANGVLSVGNALVQHPDESLWLVLGILAATYGTGLALGGAGISLSGIGAVAGVPAAAVGTGVAVVGAGVGTAAAASIGIHSATDSKVEIWMKEQPRNEKGQWTTGEGNAGKDAEKEALDDLEDVVGPIVREQRLARVEGGESRRFYDGLYENGDGTWTAIEVKSGSAKLTASQRAFDGLVSESNPAHVKLDDGRVAVITRVRLEEVG
jgi:hypothetical protein